MNFALNDPLFHDQWYVQNRGQPLSTGQPGGSPGFDINVLPVWQQGFLGAGIVIGVIDDGIEYLHPDLQPNYRPDLSFDFIRNDFDPLPVFISDAHGTAIAGIIAAQDNNNIGLIGIAPRSSIAGLQVLDAGNSFAVETRISRALSYKNQEIDIYNISLGRDGQGLEPLLPSARLALENGVRAGRGGLGNIYVWAAGNGLQAKDNVNYDGYANSRYTIATAAIDHLGKQTSFSEPGAPILVSAYSNNALTGITSTDLLGVDGYNQTSVGVFGSNYTNLDFTNDFRGTSAAAPMASGVVALMLDANPNLSWRDVQHILVNTATKNDPLDSDWRVNRAGYDINHKYGFGAVDAAASVNAARTWVSVAPEVSLISGVHSINRLIPDNNRVGISSAVTISQSISVEWVEIVFDASHSFSEDLRIVLTSPGGTQSVLAESHAFEQGDYNNWLFTSARHWGESSKGGWTLQVSDETALISGLWTSWQLRLYGTPVTPPSSTSGGPSLSVATAGDDVLQGSPGRDQLNGLAGNDRLLGLGGNDRLLGKSGNDQLLGGSGNDILNGGSGKDKLLGQGGKDKLFGGPGNDVLRGGGGRDIFVLERGLGRNKILDFKPRQDKLGLSNRLRFDRLDLLQRGRNTLVSSGGDLWAVLMGVDADELGKNSFVNA